MHLRDNLSSLTNYDKIIKFNKKAIHEFKKEIIELQHDDSKGIQCYPNSNLYIINAHQESILLYQKDILKACYSAGYPIDVIKNEFAETLESMLLAWKPHGGYFSMLNMLSIAILLDLKKEQEELFNLFQKHNDKNGDFKINDFLLDFFSNRMILI